MKEKDFKEQVKAYYERRLDGLMKCNLINDEKGFTRTYIWACERVFEDNPTSSAVLIKKRERYLKSLRDKL